MFSQHFKCLSEENVIISNAKQVIYLVVHTKTAKSDGRANSHVPSDYLICWYASEWDSSGGSKTNQI